MNAVVWFDPFVSIMDTIQLTPYNETTITPLLNVVSARFSKLMIHITDQELLKSGWNTKAVLAVAKLNKANDAQNKTGNILKLWISFHFVNPQTKRSTENMSVMKQLAQLCDIANSIHPGTIYSVTMHFEGGVKNAKVASLFQGLLKVLQTEMQQKPSSQQYKLGAMHELEECQLQAGSYSAYQKLAMPVSDVVFIDLVTDGGVSRFAGYNTPHDSVKWLAEQFKSCKANFDKLYQNKEHFEFGILTGLPDTSVTGSVSLEGLVEFWKALTISAGEENVTVILDRAFDSPYRHPFLAETRGWWRLNETYGYQQPAEYVFEEKETILKALNSTSFKNTTEFWSNKSVIFNKNYVGVSISSKHFPIGIFGLQSNFELMFETFYKHFGKLLVGPLKEDILTFPTVVANFSTQLNQACETMEIILLVESFKDNGLILSHKEFDSIITSLQSTNTICPKIVSVLLFKLDEIAGWTNGTDAVLELVQSAENQNITNFSVGIELPLVSWCLQEQNISAVFKTVADLNLSVVGISVQINWFKLSTSAERYLRQLLVLLSSCKDRLTVEPELKFISQMVYIMDWSEITEYDEDRPSIVRELIGIVTFWEEINAWAIKTNVTVILGSLVDEAMTNSSIYKPNGWWTLRNNTDKRTDTVIEDKLSTVRRVTKKRELKQQQKSEVFKLGTVEITGIVATVAIVLSILVLVQIVTWRKLRQKVYLSKEELDEFFKGKTKPAEGQDVQETTFVKQPYQREKCEIKKESFEIDFEHTIGGGEFGVVYKGKVFHCKGGSFQVAVKTVKRQGKRIGLLGMLSEIKVLSYVGNHENIIDLVGAYTAELHNGLIYVFLEYCHLGSLDKFLKTLRECNLPADQKLDEQMKSYLESNYKNLNLENGKLDPRLSSQFYKWSREVAKGMEYLASKKVVHGDVATRNILLSICATAKISDFGLSRRLYNYQSYIKKGADPLPWKWMAPEALKYSKFTEKSDVWAYGVTLWEIYSLGEAPYSGLVWTPDFVDQLENGLRLTEPKYNENSMFSLMLRCWNERPEARPSFSDIPVLLNLAFQNQSGI